jgi:hypothetical protein
VHNEGIALRRDVHPNQKVGVVVHQRLGEREGGWGQRSFWCTTECATEATLGVMESERFQCSWSRQLGWGDMPLASYVRLVSGTVIASKPPAVAAGLIA